MIGGKERVAAKWDNVKNADFDPVYEWLTDLAKNVKGEPVYTGKYDYKWRPKIGD